MPHIGPEFVQALLRQDECVSRSPEQPVKEPKVAASKKPQGFGGLLGRLKSAVARKNLVVRRLLGNRG
jgi:hypothetical protein